MIFTQKGKSNSKSQIAVIITLVIAAILLFVVVFINLANLSNIKTLTSMVADRSALSLASGIGSISYNLVKALKLEQHGQEYYKCDVNWAAIGWIIVGILAIALMALAAFPTLILLPFLVGAGGLGLSIMQAINASQTVNEAIAGKIKGMSMYNGMREGALKGALESLQTDDVILRNTGNGIFLDDDTGLSYDLSSIETMRNAKRVGRFAAWYFTKRFPLVSDENLRPVIEDFLNGLKRDPENPTGPIDFYDWDEVNWVNKKASLVVKVNQASVTCFPFTPTNPSCPSWVHTPAQGLVSVLTIDDNDRDGDGNYRPSGFLKEKFDSLGKRLENSYGVSFCGHAFLWWGTQCDDVTGLIEDLNMLVARTKELVDLPVSQRLQGIDEWMPPFYDLDYDRSKSVADQYSHDIYDRLTRDENQLTAWIAELELKDIQIRGEIPQPHGHCGYGLGGPVSQCALEACCAWDDSGNCTCACECCGTSPCTWEGTYCSCTDSGGRPPVCRSGDLYSKIPNWCPLPDNTPGCACACSPGPSYAEVNACYFQGQFPGGNTEVAQAIEILTQLVSAMHQIRGYIKTFADSASLLLPKEDVIRNEIVYAWTDKKRDNNPVYSHLVAVKLDRYPNRLPHFVEERHWGIFEKCRILKGGSNDNGSGNFTITTWRYDEDRPTPWWMMRYRKKPAQAQFDRTNLQAIVRDIQKDGLIGITTAPYLVDLTGNYAITSSAKAEYGPGDPNHPKQDIKIVETH